MKIGEKIIFMSVPRLRASPIHGWTGRFLAFF
jgi:hypothetical protein